MARLLNTFAPPFKIVGAYFFVGVFFAILSVFVFKFADFDSLIDPKTAAFFHTFLVGFVISIIIGSVYQLSSVILDKPFFTLKFAFANAFVYAFSLCVFVLGLLFGKIVFVYVGGAVLYLSMLYFSICYTLTFIKAKFESFASVCLYASSTMLFIGITLGFLMVFVAFGGLNLDFLIALKFHLYFVFGFVFFVVLGASSVLIPMFSLSHDVNFGFYYASFALFLFAPFFYDEMINFIIASVAMLVLQCFIILKKRARRAYDYWNINLYLSFVSLLLSGSFFMLDRVETAVFCLLYGFLLPFITGHIYKILPFLIWYHYVSKFVGKLKVPMLEDMVLKKIAYCALLANSIGVLLACFGMTKFAINLIFVSLILVLVNILNFMRFIGFGDQNARTNL